MIQLESADSVSLTYQQIHKSDVQLHNSLNSFKVKHFSLTSSFSTLFLQTEPPDSPNELKLSEIKSRSATITWQLPFTGNARVERMRLSLRELSASQNKLYLDGGVRNLTFSPLQSGQWTIGELQPFTNYSLTLTAINSLGESAPSESLLFQTEEEGKPIS